MRIMRVVEWRYNGVWEFNAAFVEPKEAEAHAVELREEFPADDVRIVLRKVLVSEEDIKQP